METSADALGVQRCALSRKAAVRGAALRLRVTVEARGRERTSAVRAALRVGHVRLGGDGLHSEFLSRK